MLKPFKRIAGALGAEITGVDLSTDLSDTLIEDLIAFGTKLAPTALSQKTTAS